jgi:hypothetical protein
MHLPFVLFGAHHAAKGAVVAHAAHKTAKTVAGHAVATHAAVGATAAKTAAVTKVAAHGAVAKHIAATAISAAPKAPIVP